MILNRYHRAFGVQRTVFAFDQNAIGKLQRTVDRKEDFVRRAEFNDGVLNKDTALFGDAFPGAGVAMAVGVGVVIIMAVGAAELDGNPHGSGFREEPGQAAYDVLFESVSRYLVEHGKTSILSWSRTSLASSRF